MTQPTIHGKKPVYTASNALAAIGKAIGEIRQEDGLTWAEVGRVLGKSEDQAAKYADGSAEMGIISFGLAKREWNGRFTGYFDRLCVDSRPAGVHTDQSALTHLLAAAGQLSHALEDGEITAAEVRDNRAALENARDAINEQLSKLSVVAA